MMTCKREALVMEDTTLVFLTNQAYESLPGEPCKSPEKTILNASNSLHPMSKAPIDVAHPLDGNENFGGPHSNPRFEKNGVFSSTMDDKKSLRSTSNPLHIYEKDKSQLVSCHMETNFSPSLCVQQASHNPQLYDFASSHKETNLDNFLDKKPPSADESYSLFKTKAIGCGGASVDPSRYFNALQGPELETLKTSECAILPKDQKWPFLLRFPIGCFGINLGLGSQAILWKMLANEGYMWFMHVPPLVNQVIWCVATMALIIISSTYALKIVFYLEAVRREFSHPIRINFFFAPWISCMLLALGAPPQIAISMHSSAWILFMAPILGLNLKVYGDWLYSGERQLSKVANPCTHLSLLGNFVGALLFATIGYIELAFFFWSIGIFHYLVLLVTLYQRLPGATTLSKELHPIFFLFVALPSSASVSWAKIMGKFDLLAKAIYFLAVFLFFALIAKSKIFYNLRFNIVWWAYTFPFTNLAIASIQYSLEMKHPLTQILAAFLTITSCIIVLSLVITTMLHTFVWKSMFPNDMAIAITSTRPKTKKNVKVSQQDSLPL